jgi:type IV pilus assembly protein PilW
MRAHLSSRGTTLVELMIVVAITSVVLAGAIVAANAQQRAYLDNQRLRGAQGSGRRALLALEQAIPLAGDSIDPTLAFDFSGWYSGGPCRPEMAGCPLDSVSNSDELIFYAREPRYWVSSVRAEDPAGNAWRIRGVNASTVTIIARSGDTFRNGQIFLAVCPTSSTYTYFTAGETKTAQANGDMPLSLQAVAAANPFRRQDLAAGVSCFNPTEAAPIDPLSPPHLFLVNRYRFHVRPVALNTIAGATQYDPVLVLDRGVDTNGDGRVDESDEELVAEGIESMQVAYGFYSSAIAEAGTTAGAPISFATGAAGTSANTITLTPFSGTTPYATASFFPYTFGPPPAPQRLTNAQGNVQYVRVALLARSTDVDVQSSQRATAFLPLYNQSALPTWVTNYASALGGKDGYQRVRLEATVPLPSISNRAMTYF